MMTLGTIVPSVVLHKPDHVYCGPQEPVEGHVRIRWMAKDQKTELFGPTQIHVMLRGRIKVRIGESNDAQTVRTCIPLFATRHCVHDGALQIQHQNIQNFPFQVSFPSDWRWRRDNRWKEDKMYSLDPDQPLPPSMAMLDDGIRDAGEALIQYHVEGEVTMPNLNVSISNIGTSLHRKEILYERPRMLTAVPLQLAPCQGTLVVRDRCLIPESMRPDPHGFRQRASAIFRPGPKPESVLDWTITIPKNIHRGQPFVVAVRCHPSTEKSTAPEPPELRLLGIQARADAQVAARSSEDSWLMGGWSQSREIAKEVVTTGSPATRDGGPSTISATGEGAESVGLPFDKGNDWTQTVLLETLTNDMCSSITAMCIRRIYIVFVKCQISVAGKHQELSRSTIVEVLPPLMDQAGSFPSSPLFTNKEGLPAESLPEYQP